MNSKTAKENKNDTREQQLSQENSNKQESSLIKTPDQHIENLCDENLTTLEKIHAILINCINLSKKQKLEFAESERYFMKIYLKKLKDKLEE